MAVHSLRLSELASLSDSEKSQAMSRFLHKSGTPNGQLAELDRRIATFERVYETTSEMMRAELASGTRKETAEICQWLMLLELRERVSR